MTTQNITTRYGIDPTSFIELGPLPGSAGFFPASGERVPSFCCICSTKLDDATSIELGIGPVCRRKYQIDITPDEETFSQAVGEFVALHVSFPGLFPPEFQIRFSSFRDKEGGRKMANLLTWFASQYRNNRPVVFAVCDLLETLKYTVLATKLRSDRSDVVLTHQEEGKVLLYQKKKHKDFQYDMKVFGQGATWYDADGPGKRKRTGWIVDSNNPDQFQAMTLLLGYHYGSLQVAEVPESGNPVFDTIPPVTRETYRTFKNSVIEKKNEERKQERIQRIQKQRELRLERQEQELADLENQVQQENAETTENPRTEENAQANQSSNIQVSLVEDSYQVWTPFNINFLQGIKAIEGYKGISDSGAWRCHSIPKTARQTLWDLLIENFPGHTGETNGTTFVVPSEKKKSA